MEWVLSPAANLPAQQNLMDDLRAVPPPLTVSFSAPVLVTTQVMLITVWSEFEDDPSCPHGRRLIDHEGYAIVNYFELNGTIAEVPASETTPPVLTISASSRTLWPPNGKMVPVTISGTMTDAGSGVRASTATYTVIDEYGRVQPSGPITLGTNGTYSFTILLQASRNGNDQDGRKYTITVRAQDNAGNNGSASTNVIVPHDQGN